MNRFEKRKQAIDAAIREQIGQYKDIYKTADAADRDPTDEERLEIESHLRAIDTLKAEKGDVEANIKTLDDVDRISREVGGPAVPALDSIGQGNGSGSGVVFSEGYGPVPGGHPFDKGVALATKSIGEQLTDSRGFKSVQEQWKGGRHQFSTGVEVQTKAGTLTQAATLGAGMIPVPQVLPGMQGFQFQRLTVEDLLDGGQIGTNSIRYVVEGTATSGAAAVAEAAPKPASQLGYSTVDEPVKKIATSLVITDEMLEDVQTVQSVVNARLSTFVQNRVETSLLSGAGTNDLVGLLNAGRSISSMAKGGGIGGTASDGPQDALFRALNGVRGSALLEPTAILMSPQSWQNIRLQRDAAGGTAGQYMGGGPFGFGPYGVGEPAMSSNQLTGATGPNDVIWGKPVYVTSAISAGSAVIVTRQGAQVFNRGGLNVEASNSGYLGGVDLFTSNLVAIRAERRLALCVFRPSAFCLVTGI